jgi:hypothetical protein
MPRRSALAPEVVNLVGPAATLIEAGTGWPSTIDIDLGENRIARLAAHLGLVHSMSRKEGELRFQNPGSRRPPLAPPGALPMLIGLLPGIDGDPPALIVPENSRIGQTTRFTVLFRDGLAREGARTGWATNTTTKGERFWAISPRLLPALVLMLEAGSEPPMREIRTAAQAAGPLLDEDDATKERARVATSRLARSAMFRSQVLDAYGHRCALCGLSPPGLLEAAHIFPVGMPGSADVADNGIPLCLHHHALLDTQQLHISPTDLSVSIFPDLHKLIGDPALAELIANTAGTLEPPGSLDPARLRHWLAKRQAVFTSAYGWAMSRK